MPYAAATVTAGRPHDAIDQDFWAFFRQSHVALYLAAPDGTVIDVNAAAARLLGAADVDALLRGRQNVFEWRRSAEDRRAFAGLLERNEAGQSIRTRLVTRGGDEILVDECACRTSATRIIGAISRAEVGGLSDRESMARDLERAKIEAERASRFRSEFLANLSHEFRTPLNGIIGGADVILSNGRDDSVRQFAEVIRDSGERLLRLLNDILDLSKVESGHLAVNFSSVDLTELIKSLDAEYAPRASEKGLRFEARTAANAPLLVETDGTRVRQILSKLIENALKFTASGGFGVAVGVEGAAPGVLVFAVRDTGCGIPEEALDRIFMPFEQLDSATARRFGGAGLGLTLAVRLADLIGGSVTVASREGEGSTFTLRLPLTENSAAVSPSKRIGLPAPEPAFSGAILVVDDVPMNVMVASELLKPMGLRAVPAGAGAEAVARMMQGDFRAVLMDVSMPDMDGVAATAAIRALGGAAAATPIIAVTANVFPGDRERYLEAGMDGYVAKPVTADALRAELARVFGARS